MSAANLQTYTITSPVTALATGILLAGLDTENKSLLLQFAFAYGSGGTSGTCWLQSSADGGTTWYDIAAFGFAQANKTEIFNVRGSTPVLTPVAPTDGGLASDTTFDGILGDLVRLKLTTTGTYAGTTLTATAVTH